LSIVEVRILSVFTMIHCYAGEISVAHLSPFNRFYDIIAFLHVHVYCYS